MGEYTQLGGVKTWHETSGDSSNDPLVLLHGGMSEGSAWGANAPAFAERYHVHIPDRRGHGKTPDVAGPHTYADMADDAIAFLEQVVGGSAHLVGWSDGGNIALLVSLRRPDLVRRQVLVGANFHHDGLLPQFDLGDDPNAEDVAVFKMMYEATAVDPANWPTFFAKTTRLWQEEPNLTAADLKMVAAPTMVLVGDDDAIFWEHTLALYQSVSGSQLAVMPGTSHTCALEKPVLFNELVLAFLAETGVPTTMVPIRRATDA